MQEIEAIAKEIAAYNGRDWSDMGAYERNDYVFEAERRRDGVALSSTENEKITVAHKAIASLWGDTMGWEQIETLARATVRALDAHEASLKNR